MKKIILSIGSFLISMTMQAQDITGQWNGMLNIQSMQLRLVFHIEETDEGYVSKLDSPDQGAFGIATSSTEIKDSAIVIRIANLNAKYEGNIMADNKVSGTFEQNGMRFPLELSREEIEKPKFNRPQNPSEPYPYHTEEVSIPSVGGSVTLAGTLSMPQKEGEYPVAILISGSGPQNRDEELMNHKPFLVISDYLTRQGIAVLRYDDRGVAESTGDFSSATSEDFAEDVESIVKYLKSRKEFTNQAVGLIGHSEGGLIAPMVAVNSSDVGFIVLMAGPGISGDKILYKQTAIMGKAQGMTDEQIKQTQAESGQVYDILKNTPVEGIRKAIADFINEQIDKSPDFQLPAGMSQEEFVENQLKNVATPWMKYFVSYDPVPTLQKVNCPVLAINGEKDVQVLPKENLEAIGKALKVGGNDKVTTKEYPSLNHLFQESETGMISEYAQIEQTISPVVLKDMSDWIKANIK